LNERIFKNLPLSLIPLLDMPNHLQPQNLDMSDLVTFRFKVSERHNPEKNTTSRYIGFPSDASLQSGQEFMYAYSNKL
jgi:hypothetical protein